MTPEETEATGIADELLEPLAALEACRDYLEHLRSTGQRVSATELELLRSCDALLGAEPIAALHARAVRMLTR